MSIDDLIADSGEDVYYTSAFHIEVESQFPRMLEEGMIFTQTVTNLQGVVYEGDFFGLLRELKVPDYAHWVALRMNGYDSPTQFMKTTTSVILPNLSELDMVKSVFISNEDYVL